MTTGTTNQSPNAINHLHCSTAPNLLAKKSDPTVTISAEMEYVSLLLALLQLCFCLTASELSVGVGSGVGLWIGQTAPPAATSSGTEYTALQAWKQAITEDPKGYLSTWNGPNVCTYRGVFCSPPPDDENYQPGTSSSPANVVAGIDLNKANMKGSLVKELSFLTHLTFFHLNSNRFTGTVPDSLDDLQYLSELDLSNNQFTGPFPAVTLAMPSLTYLDLRFNGFSGEVPGEVFEREQLDAVFLNDNSFGGQIPTSLWSSSASVITLANNNFDGSIPTSFGYTNGGIKEVLLLNNKLTGCVPDGLGFLSNIQVLDLSFNSLAGHLPNSLSCLSGIEVLNIAHNQLSGELPDILCGLKNLANLSVSFNFFSGFSQGCSKLVDKNVGFDFSSNCIPGGNMQRPQPECSGTAPGSDLSCFRIPTPRSFACAGAAILIDIAAAASPEAGSPVPSSPLP